MSLKSAQREKIARQTLFIDITDQHNGLPVTFRLVLCM